MRAFVVPLDVEVSRDVHWLDVVLRSEMMAGGGVNSPSEAGAGASLGSGGSGGSHKRGSSSVVPSPVFRER